MQTNNRLRKFDSKWYFPIGFIIFFGILSSMEFFLVYVARNSDTGVVIEGEKREQMQYNSRLIATRKEQEALQWQDNIEVQQVSSTIDIVFTLKNKSGENIKCDSATAKLMRPVTDKYDRVIKLEHISDKFVGSFELALPGQWDIHITAACEYGVEFSSNKRIIAQFSMQK